MSALWMWVGLYAGLIGGFLGGAWFAGRSRQAKRHRQGIAVISGGEMTPGVFTYDIRRLTVLSSTGDERRLNLVISSEGVFVEIDLGDGSELMQELYEGRTWLFGLQEATDEHA